METESVDYGIKKNPPPKHLILESQARVNTLDNHGKGVFFFNTLYSH